MEVSADSEQRFQVGYEVGDIAQQLYPNGMLIDDQDLGDAIISTHKALAEHPINTQLVHNSPAATESRPAAEPSALSVR